MKQIATQRNHCSGHAILVMIFYLSSKTSTPQLRCLQIEVRAQTVGHNMNGIKNVLVSFRLDNLLSILRVRATSW